ncbi:MAG: isoprenyl transferase [bacterium]
MSDPDMTFEPRDAVQRSAPTDDSAAERAQIERFRAELAGAALPRHVAVIMDGNGRWAERRGQTRVLGHRRGAAAVRQVIRTSSRLGIEVLTLYAFSRENWSRPPDEVRALMSLIRRYVRNEVEEIHEQRVRFNVIGRFEELPAEVRRDLGRAMDKTRDNDGMLLNVALSYSGRVDILDACRRLATRVAAGTLSAEALTADDLGAELSTAGMPDPDLLIRTGGDLRVSNFLLWQIAYAELYFTDVLWPDFSNQHLFDAIGAYAGRERRFGKTSSQVRPSPSPARDGARE